MEKKIYTYPGQDQVIDDIKPGILLNHMVVVTKEFASLAIQTSKHGDCIVFLRPNVPT